MGNGSFLVHLPSGRAIASLRAALLAAALAVACGPTSAADVARYRADEPIRIGFIGHLSGDLARIGVPMAETTEFAGKGVLIEGHRIEFVRVDSGCDAADGVAAAKQLIDAGVVAVVGPACGEAVLAAQPLFEQAGITHISPSTTMVEATHPPGRDPYPTFLRMYYSDAVQGRSLASFADSPLRAGSAYLVHEDSAYGQALADTFVAEFERRQGVLAGRQSYTPGAADVAAVVSEVRAEVARLRPGVVAFFGDAAEGGALVSALREDGLDVPVLASDRVRQDEFLRLAGARADGVYISLPHPEIPPGAYDAFLGKFDLEAADVEIPFEPYGELRSGEGGGRYRRLPAYDASMVIVNALQQVARADGDELRVDRDALNKAIRSVDIEGVTGRIKFDQRGDNVGKETPIVIFTVEGQQFVEHSRMLGVTPY